MKSTINKIALMLVLIAVITACSTRNDNEPVIKFKTTKGTIVVKLYAETPLHRDNFVKLVESGYYNGVLFHRVIRDFMIQAGDPVSRNARKNQMLGSGDVSYTIPAEIVYPKYFHKKGALAAARQGDDINPERASSGAQFYLVQGKFFTDAQLDTLEMKRKTKYVQQLFDKNWEVLSKNLSEKKIKLNNLQIAHLRDSLLTDAEKKVEVEKKFTFNPEQRLSYKTIGGTPHLDGEYTVFGEVIKGLDIVSNISVVKTGKFDRPIDNVRILSATRIK